MASHYARQRSAKLLAKLVRNKMKTSTEESLQHVFIPFLMCKMPSNWLFTKHRPLGYCCYTCQSFALIMSKLRVSNQVSSSSMPWEIAWNFWRFPVQQYHWEVDREVWNMHVIAVRDQWRVQCKGPMFANMAHKAKNMQPKLFFFFPGGVIFGKNI